jgi:hypothetical protein
MLATIHYGRCIIALSVFYTPVQGGRTTWNYPRSSFAKNNMNQSKILPKNPLYMQICDPSYHTLPYMSNKTYTLPHTTLDPVHYTTPPRFGQRLAKRDWCRMYLCRMRAKDSKTCSRRWAVCAIEGDEGEDERLRKWGRQALSLELLIALWEAKGQIYPSKDYRRI